MTNRAAFTLLECLVAMTVVAILLTLALVSLGAAREASRRQQCQNHQRQLAIALHLYSDSRKQLPNHDHETDRAYARSPGPFYDLADYLGLSELADQLVSNGHVFEGTTANIPSWFICPSDPHEGCNMRACTGSGMLMEKRGYWVGMPVWRDSANGLVIGPKGLTFAAVKDGLSNTAFCSERSLGDGDRRGVIANVQMYQEIQHYVQDGAPYDALAAFVAENWGDLEINPNGGRGWHHAYYTYTAYNHTLPPNHAFAATFLNPLSGLVGPSSHHAGGVNLTYADGSTRFVADQIDMPLWRALASIDGSE